MKTVLALAVFALSLSSFAASVKISSFAYVRNAGDAAHPLAELCGVVEGDSFPSFVSVVVDPKSKNPGSYNTMTDTNGKFCLAVITYRGQAEVGVMGKTSTVEALIK